MIKKIIFFICFSTWAFSYEIECQFEEVYKDGSVQNGLLLLSNGNLRYEYFGKNLYTIIKNPRGVFLINNMDKNQSQNIYDPIVTNLLKIFNDYPNLEKTYSFDDIKIKVYFDKKKEFINRIGLLSSRINMSIYFNTCQKKIINNYYFNESPLIDYSQYNKN